MNKDLSSELGPKWVEWLSRRPEVSNDFYRVTKLPGKFGRNSVYQVPEQDKDYNCAEMIAMTTGLLQGLELVSNNIAQAIRLSEAGVDPISLYHGLIELGVVARYRERVNTKWLRNRLSTGDCAVIVDMQDQETEFADLLTGDGGHIMMAYCWEERPRGDDIIWFGDPGYDGSSRITATEMPWLWYDVELASQRMFYGSAIEIPITVSRTCHPGVDLVS